MRAQNHHQRFAVWLLVWNLVSGVNGALCASENEYEIRRWTTAKGLPQNTITSIHQTKDGYLWVGTRSGLARFDSRKFTPLDHSLTGLDSGGMYCRGLTSDGDGRLWIRTDKALNCFSRGRFQTYPFGGGPLEGEIQTFCASRRGGLWLASGLELKYFENGKIAQTFEQSGSLVNAPILQLSEDFEGRVWVGARDTSWRWHRIDPQTKRWEAFADIVRGAIPEEVVSVLPGRDGSLWLAAAGELIGWTAGGEARRFATPSGWGTSPIRDLQMDIAGTIWGIQGSPERVVRFRQGQFLGISVAEGLGDSDVRCIYGDREGSLWVGTGFGLNQLEPRPLATHFSTNSAGDKNEVFSIAPGRDGRIWFGGSSGLIEYQNGRVVTYTNATRSWHGRYLDGVRTVLENSRGQVWFGVEREGLQTLEEGQFRRVLAPGVEKGESWSINTLFEDAQRRIWICSQSGLFCWQDGTISSYTTAHGLSDNQVMGIQQAPDGSLWIGTRAGGINHFHNGGIRSLTMRDGLLSNAAVPLLVESDGTLWVGTEKGLNRVRDGLISAVTMREGLYHHQPGSLIDDRRGNYWSHGNAGIWRVRKGDLHAVADGKTNRLTCLYYGEADGMISSEGNAEGQPSACRLEDGRLWFPTIRGAVEVDPGKLIADEVAPLVVIEQVIADDKTVYNGGVVSLPSGSTQSAVTGEASQGHDGVQASLRLAAGSARVLKIRFTANSFVSPENVRVQYRLEPGDNQWHDDEGARMALFPNLRPGDYRFQVKACNRNGYWNEAGQSVAFFIAPHFYETRWFYSVCLVGIMGAAYGIHRVRVRVVRDFDRLRQSHALELERARIAQDMHDDLGANLTKIAILSEIAKKNLVCPKTAEAQVDLISATARTVVDNITEIIWATSPENDTMDNLCAYLRGYAAQQLELASIQAELDFPSSNPGRSISSEARRSLFLVVKEALHNIVKHAGATRAELRLRVTGTDDAVERRGVQRSTSHVRPGTIELMIMDNGKGFDSLSVGQFRNGLKNMRKRVHDLGGTLAVHSEPAKGTRIVISAPLIMENSKSETRNPKQIRISNPRKL